MLTKPLVNLILADDALTRGLGDAEARLLVEWVVESAERATTLLSIPEAAQEVRRLLHRGRVIARFVLLWSQHPSRGAALQLLASERVEWPIPPAWADAYETLQILLAHESQHYLHQPTQKKRVG